MEMLRMATVYLSEGNTENAYILYLRFLVLFLEKIKKHPEYKLTLQDAKMIQGRLKEALATTEKLKIQLRQRYEREYGQFLATRRIEEQREAERRSKLKEMERNTTRILTPSIQDFDATFVPASAPDFSLLDDVVYPNDFAAEPRHPNSAGSKGSSGLAGGGILLPPPPPPPSYDTLNSTANNTKPAAKPHFDRSLKPSSSLIEGDMRPVIIPIATMERFLRLAQVNTVKNIETCGILAGKLASNKLIITHVIIPKQNGTSDSCTASNEEEIFNYQDQHNLITLGWIHTHPSQTAFMSSIDLHTHCPYQMMMTEAIAIVCAPTYNTTGFFFLTPNGLSLISQCRLTGFHPHPDDPPLYMNSEHIILDDTTRIEMVDLR